MTKVEEPEEEEYMDMSQNISTEHNAHISGALPYQPTEVRAVDYVIVTVACLGIVGNLVSLAVWNTNTTYNPVIFLFKYLAVVDIEHLVSSFSWRIFIFFRRYLSAHTYFTVLFTLYGTELLGQALSVHTTLLIAVCRFLSVSRPLEVYNGSLLTRCQIIAACVIFFCWCLLITTPFPVITLLVFNDKLQVSYFFTVVILFLGTSFATLLLVVFDILLLKKLHSSSALKSSSVSSAQCPSRHGRRISQRVTLVVVLMSMCSILAYLVSGTSLALAFMYFYYTKELSPRAYFIVFEILVPTYELLEALNSSINIIFYYAFFHKFRKVFPTVGINEEITESSNQIKKTMNRNLSDDLH